MASIKCGNCKNTHNSVEEVRGCYAGVNAPSNSGNDTFAKRTPAWTPDAGTPVDRIRDYAQRLPNVKTMHYAVLVESPGSGEKVWRFFRVDRPQTGRWAGYTFVKRQAGDEEYPVKNLSAVADILKEISFDPQSAAENYGLQLGKCGCCQRTLTNPDSIKRGIGPICAEKIGW